VGHRRLEQQAGRLGVPALLERLVGERVETISDELAAVVDRELAMLADRMDTHMTTAAEGVAVRAAEASSLAVVSGLERTVERMERAIDAVERMQTTGADVAGGGDATGHLERHVDDRLAALAKMIRSDNRILAERMPAASAPPSDAESAKLVLRAVKEMQATLAGDVTGSMDRRFQAMADQLHSETQSTAEAMVKVAEVMGQKIDRLSVRIDEGYGNDIQVVIDRMGEAIAAMSGRGVRRQEPFDL
jgi:hypothetical protein